MGQPRSGSSLSEEPVCQVTLACLLQSPLQGVVQLGGESGQKSWEFLRPKRRPQPSLHDMSQQSEKRVCSRHVSLVTALIPPLKHLQHVWAIYKCSNLLYSKHRFNPALSQVNGKFPININGPSSSHKFLYLPSHLCWPLLKLPRICHHSSGKQDLLCYFSLHSGFQKILSLLSVTFINILSP